MRKVYIIDSNYPEDHYSGLADGIVAQYILKALGIDADLRLALDRKHFGKAVDRALKAGCDVLHISTHGNDSSIALCNDLRGGDLPEGYDWPEFVDLFQGRYDPPTAFVMSACGGASMRLAQTFTDAKKRPKIIIGSSDDRSPADYVAAWALLYRRFKRKGIKRDVAQKALEDIAAVVHKNFRYFRWDDQRNRYLRYPSTGSLFDVNERAK